MLVLDNTQLPYLEVYNALFVFLRTVSNRARIYVIDEFQYTVIKVTKTKEFLYQC